MADKVQSVCTWSGQCIPTHNLGMPLVPEVELRVSARSTKTSEAHWVGQPHRRVLARAPRRGGEAEDGSLKRPQLADDEVLMARAAS